MKKVHHQYSGGHAVWTSHIISTEEVVQYMATKTIQGVAGGCIYLGKWYFTDKITQISSDCDESRCPEILSGC